MVGWLGGWVQGLGLGFRVQGSGFRVQGGWVVGWLGGWVQGFGLPSGYAVKVSTSEGEKGGCRVYTVPSFACCLPPAHPCRLAQGLRFRV